MPKKVAIKKIANAMLMGLKLTYSGHLQRSRRELLYELLDDMAVALTKEGIEEGNVFCAEFSNILGLLSDEIDIPIKPEKWPTHKANGKGKHGRS
jgi:hypothetical protein